MNRQRQTELADRARELPPAEKTVRRSGVVYARAFLSGAAIGFGIATVTVSIGARLPIDPKWITGILFGMAQIGIRYTQRRRGEK